jgi:hypothetical protein
MPQDFEFEPATLFYSYSHHDEDLCEKLRRHLSAMERLGQIRSWDDRCIDAGRDWEHEINAKLQNAEIILLLVSPDFISSDYCYCNEMKVALQRHERGEAIVIPILLRPVDFEGLPFAKLEMLPAKARAVRGGWSSEDEALTNVAEGIRKQVRRVIDKRWYASPPSERRGFATEGRALEGAMAQTVPVGETREILTVARLSASSALHHLLSEDRQYNRNTYSCEVKDIRSENFRARYMITAQGEFSSPDYQLSVNAPGLKLEGESKRFHLEPMYDSPTFKFLAKAEQEGEYRVRVDLASRGFAVAETLLKTTATEHRPGGGKEEPTGLLATVEFVVRAIAKSAASGRIA